MLKNFRGEEVKFGPGMCIGFDRKHHFLILFDRSKSAETIYWPDSDDKKLLSCCSTDGDFADIVKLIADITGLRPGEMFELSYGPVCQFA